MPKEQYIASAEDGKNKSRVKEFFRKHWKALGLVALGVAFLGGVL